jgi:hypothetical protein
MLSWEQCLGTYSKASNISAGGVASRRQGKRRKPAIRSVTMWMIRVALSRRSPIPMSSTQNVLARKLGPRESLRVRPTLTGTKHNRLAQACRSSSPSTSDQQHLGTLNSFFITVKKTSNAGTSADGSSESPPTQPIFENAAFHGRLTVL